MNDKIIKKIGIKQDTGKYIYADIGVDADKVEINESMNLAEKIVEIDNKFEDLEAGGYANKDIYGDEKINLGRKTGTAAGPYSVTIGRDVSAIGTCSLAEGKDTAAKGNYSHAEGSNTIASGENSHSEGNGTIAGGNASHSEGENTIASGRAQHVQGQYNIEDTEDRYAHIVGGGTYDERKNIHTLDWYGNAEFAGDVIAHDENGNEVSLISLSGSGGSSDDCASKAIYGDNHVSLGRELGTTVGNDSFAFGYEVEASGEYSHAEGSETTASGDYSHAEGYGNTAKGDHSHSEGYNTIASEGASHSEGYGTKASGARSHAEGSGTTASGHSSHAEGTSTIASGAYSHAEGDSTTTSGFASHAEGYYTIAKGNYQHVQGKYNKEDTSLKYAHIVGGGTSNSKRKNIHTLDWQGNAEFAGDVIIHDLDGNAISLVDAISLINTALTNANLL